MNFAFAFNTDPALLLESWGLWLGALGAGVVGSVHCMAMCSPLVCVVCTHGHKPQPRTPSSRIPAMAVYLTARLVSYTTLGFASGMAGAAFLGSSPSIFVKIALSAAVIVTCVLAIKPRLWTQGLGSRLSHLPGILGVGQGSGAGVLGLVTPLLPCGLLWSITLLAAQSGTPLRGAAIMAAFALGSAPGLALGPSLMRTLRKRLNTWWPYVFFVFVAGAGALTLHRIWNVTAEMPCHSSASAASGTSGSSTEL